MSIERTTRIEVNGQEYGSVDEMPPDVRRLYEEAMRQLREQGPGGPGPAEPGKPQVHTTVRTTRRLVVNGQEVSSLDELPEGMRDVVRAALANGETETVIGGERHIEVRDEPQASAEQARARDAWTRTRADGGKEQVVIGSEPVVVGSKPAREQPVWADWMGRARERRRFSFQVSPARLVFWLALVALILYLWLRRH